MVGARLGSFLCPRASALEQRAMMRRAFDVAASLGGLLVLVPVFLVLGLAVKLCDGGPVFFRHPRTGRNRQSFRMWKFRTMRVGADRVGPNVTAAHDPRVTAVGHFLRRYRLDELPQLFNVLSGDMALVGPRPESPSNAQRYPASAQAVLELKPGITDPGTLAFLYRETELISGRPDAEAAYLELVVPARVPLSMSYAHRASLWSDVLVIIATLRGLLIPATAWRSGWRLSGLGTAPEMTATQVRSVGASGR